MARDEHYAYSRDIPVSDEWDLVVAGGGPAGTTAALAAARRGRTVCLIEQTGALDGMGSNGYVSSWYCLGNNVETMVGGLAREIPLRLYEAGGVEPGRSPEEWLVTKRGFGFDPETIKVLLDQMCAESGVTVFFANRVVDTVAGAVPGSLDGLVLSGPEGLRVVKGTTIIDATSDGTVSRMAGFPVRRAGRDTERIMAPTLCARMVGIDYARFDRNRDQQALVDQAVTDGFFSQPDRHVPGLFRTGEGNAIMNAGHLFDTDALDTSSLSKAYAWGRRLAHEYTRFFRERAPGCDEIELAATANLMGVRESIRILGEYDLTWDDFRIRRTFHDQIGIYCKQVDIHVYDTSPEEYARFQAEFESEGEAKPADGEYYGIPYGVLVPKGSVNTWVAGRCVSTDPMVNGSLRDQPGCMLLGEAAGSAAAQHVRTGQPAHALDTAELVGTLREAGAKLPQPETRREMTRG
ncbi:MAG: FAD-dependent oxidoreductase [Alkalispirochaeta sp.]